MKRFILTLFCVSLASTHLFSDDSFQYQNKRQGKASGYSSRDATVLSMMGWGVGLAVGIGTFFALMDNNGSSSSGGGGGGDNGHSHFPLTQTAFGKVFMKNWSFFFLFFFVLFFKAGFSQEEVCLFSPPKDWKIALPKNKSEYVQVGFITQGEKGFHPSINLAIEEVDVNLKEYIQAIKELHTAKPDTKWRDLGKFKMEGGMGRLTEISNEGPWGPVKMLQAILVKNQKAYILTAATLKSEFPQFQREILKSLKTLKTAKDLFSFLPNTPRRQELIDTFASLNQKIEDPNEQQKKWVELQNLAATFQEEMGPQWQFLLLKEGHAKIYNTEKFLQK